MSALPAGVEYQLMGLRVVRGSSLLSGKGSIYLNDLRYQINHHTALEQTQVQVAPAKELRDGHLFIRHNSRTYDAAGIEVK